MWKLRYVNLWFEILNAFCENVSVKYTKWESYCG